MEQHEFLQGTPEWHAHRASHYNASDAPAMMGCSPYKTRAQLLHEYHTGLTKDVDAATQRRFDDGHRFEALARPIAEGIIGKRLYPVVGSEGKYSASFDGLTMDESIGFEHKSLNNNLREVMVEGCTGADLPLMYRIQMEQQHLVSGAEKTLFMASDWDGNELDEERHCWYEPMPELREQIIAGWEQFEKDLSAYVPPEVKEVPKVEAVESFPVPAILVKGELVECNLDAITPIFDRFLAETKTTLKTDNDFAQAVADAKSSRESAKNCKLTAKSVIDQIMPVSEVVRTLESYADKFDKLGLTLEKAVKEQKDIIKANAISKAKSEFNLHVSQLEEEIKPIKLLIPPPNFADAIKGLKNLDSMHAEIDTALRNGKFDADKAAKDIRDKLAWCRTNAEGYGSLFPDMQSVIQKPMDDFMLTVTTRIEAHKNEVAAKVEQERVAQAAKEAEQKAVVPSVVDAQVAATPAPKAANEPVVDARQAVIDHEPVIRDFMESRDFGKEANKVRAILVEFVKFQATHGLKKAA